MCGITAAIVRPKAGRTETVFPEALRMLAALSHRGQEGHGFAAYNPPYDTFDVTTSSAPINIIPLLSDAQMRDTYRDCHGTVVLGQVRYATAGGLQPENLQPMRNDSSNRLPPARRKVMVYNGNMANARLHRRRLKSKNVEFRGNTDTEVLLRMIAREDQKLHGHTDAPSDYAAIFKNIDKQVDGAASLIMTDGLGNAVFYRNSLGLRPLYYMETDDGLILAASETVAFEGHKGTIRSVPPGHVVVYDRAQDKLITHCVSPPAFAPCASEVAAEKLDVFEPLYFQSAASEVYGQSNNETRRQLGAKVGSLLAEQLRGMQGDERKNVRIVPMPHSGIPYALGAHETLAGLGLLAANAFSMPIAKVARLRAFIGNTKRRAELLGSNYQIIKSEVEGKILYLFDDTLVRGDTSRVLTQRLLEAGAKEVHWVIGAPPIIGSDYYGINIPSLKELAFWQVWKGASKVERAKLYPSGENPAERMDLSLLGSKMARRIGATSVTYLPLKDLKEILPGGAERYNFSSLNGIYPTPWGQKLFDRAYTHLIAA